MALTDIRAMFGEGNCYRGSRTIKRNYLKNRNSGMDNKLDWAKHKNSSSFAAQEIRPATSLSSWCCKIPIGDGFHEFI